MVSEYWKPQVSGIRVSSIWIITVLETVSDRCTVNPQCIADRIQII